MRYVFECAAQESLSEKLLRCGEDAVAERRVEAFRVYDNANLRASDELGFFRRFVKRALVEPFDFDPEPKEDLVQEDTGFFKGIMEQVIADAENRLRAEAYRVYDNANLGVPDGQLGFLSRFVKHAFDDEETKLDAAFGASKLSPVDLVLGKVGTLRPKFSFMERLARLATGKPLRLPPG